MKIKHDCHHHAYLDLSLPDEWKRFIETNAGEMTPNQVSTQTSLYKPEVLIQGVDLAGNIEKRSRYEEFRRD